MIYSSSKLESNKRKEKNQVITETPIPQNPKQNLESKIESIIRTIENLSEKKIRIDFELRRQKKSLARKREELKRVSRSSQAKVSLSLENSFNTNLQEIEDQQYALKRTQFLLQESARILEE